MRPRATGGRVVGPIALVAAALLGSGCGDTDRAPRPTPDAGERVVTVYFTRGEAPVAVARAVPAERADLSAVLEQLLAGPTAAERAQGITSWFSTATAGSLRSATVDRSGRAIVDFADLPGAIPNASSSTGSALLLQELNGTVFADPAVRSVEYRTDGSCEAFWNWLQYDCRIVVRPGT